MYLLVSFFLFFLESMLIQSGVYPCHSTETALVRSVMVSALLNPGLIFQTSSYLTCHQDLGQMVVPFSFKHFLH